MTNHRVGDIDLVIVGPNRYQVDQGEEAPPSTYRAILASAYAPGGMSSETELYDALGSHLILTPNKEPDSIDPDGRSTLVIPIGPGVIIGLKA